MISFSELRIRVTRRFMEGAGSSRLKWYAIYFVLITAVIWMAAGAYLVLSPKNYTSTFMMIIPGPGGASSVNLENVGSSTTTSSSVFSSPDISPTENYKRVILSHRVAAESAAASGIQPEAFPVPRVDLLEQTKLLKISINARSPELSVERALSLQHAFLKVLDELRDDEIKQRESRTESVMNEYKKRLQEAKENLLSYQLLTGLMSIDQYKEIVGNLEKIRTMVRETEAHLAKNEAEEKSLVSLLGADAADASRAMLLRSDPVFQALLETAAKQEAEISTLNGIRGNGNPRLQDAIAEKASTVARLSSRAAEILGRKVDVTKIRDVSLRDERARLFEKIVNLTSETASLKATRDEMIKQRDEEQNRITGISSQASVLERLNREVQLAEAVFTSALGRSDSGRSDVFASYPMVQTLETPLLPDKPSSPQPVLAVGGAVLGTLLTIFALGLSWLRIELFRRILRNA